MKKIFTIVSFLLITTSAFAQKVVPIVWPFSPASSQANLIRATIDSANTQQNKYQFVFQNKPGAGGTVAVLSAKESKELSVLATSSSFYIRPLLYKDSHNVDDFTMVAPLCNAQPLAIFSKKINRLSDVQDREASIGVLPGSITTLAVKAIKRENPGIRILEVPYKGTPEATSDMLGSHIDGSVDFIGSTVTSRFGNDIKVLGMTGTRSYNGYPTFQSLKIKGLEQMTVDYFFFVNKSVDGATKQELYKILTDALTERTKTICEDDFGHIVKTPYNQLDAVHQSNKTLWEKQTAGIPKE
jgi:tripartite-type tricarboxylate transporter receptor subunit TctC